MLKHTEGAMHYEAQNIVIENSWGTCISLETAAQQSHETRQSIMLPSEATSQVLQDPVSPSHLVCFSSYEHHQRQPVLEVKALHRVIKEQLRNKALI